MLFSMFLILMAMILVVIGLLLRKDGEQTGIGQFMYILAWLAMIAGVWNWLMVSSQIARMQW